MTIVLRLRSLRPLWAALRIVLLALGAGLPALADNVNIEGPSAEAASFLEFESVPDGRCQILSAGGKLRVVHNRHVERGIDFRLVRLFAGNHRQGLVVGQLAAGETGMKLGCTEVDGRKQDWVVERARYLKQD